MCWELWELWTDLLKRPPIVRELSMLPRAVLTVLVFGFALLAMAPQITTFVTSFVKTKGPLFVQGFSLESYSAIMFKLSDCVIHTFTYSTVSIFFIIIIDNLVKRSITDVDG
jgi:iron(III) transport system permease protein